VVNCAVIFLFALLSHLLSAESDPTRNGRKKSNEDGFGAFSTYRSGLHKASVAYCLGELDETGTALTAKAQKNVGGTTTGVEEAMIVI
jgi:hypothetical protein